MPCTLQIRGLNKINVVVKPFIARKKRGEDNWVLQGWGKNLHSKDGMKILVGHYKLANEGLTPECFRTIELLGGEAFEFVLYFGWFS